MTSIRVFGETRECWGGAHDRCAVCRLPLSLRQSGNVRLKYTHDGSEPIEADLCVKCVGVILAHAAATAHEYALAAWGRS